MFIRRNPIPLIDRYLTTITQNKHGIEIGGPSETGKTIYKSAETIDNVIFSRDTVWSTHSTNTYSYYPGKSGKVIIHDATDISSVNDGSYDFLFASHCLEHIANPIKALFEFKRIVKENGFLILVLPEKSMCFDHRRNVSQFSVLLEQYNNNVSEDDLSTLPEILELHDLSMDICAGTFEQFKARSLQNVENRCLHHYVYSERLLQQLCEYIKCKYVYSVTIGLNIWFIMQI